jgi:hypothetical protein
MIRDMVHDTARSIVHPDRSPRLWAAWMLCMDGTALLAASLVLQRPSGLDRLLFMLMQGEKNGSKPPAFQTWKLATLYFL